MRPHGDRKRGSGGRMRNPWAGAQSDCAYGPRGEAPVSPCRGAARSGKARSCTSSYVTPLHNCIDSRHPLCYILASESLTCVQPRLGASRQDFAQTKAAIAPTVAAHRLVGRPYDVQTGQMRSELSGPCFRSATTVQRRLGETTGGRRWSENASSPGVLICRAFRALHSPRAHRACVAPGSAQ